MTAIRTILVLMFALVLTHCAEPIVYKYDDLGLVKITDHKKPHGGMLRQLCQFRVEAGGLTLGYAGSSSQLNTHNKCLTMKNGDTIAVTRRTRTSGDDKMPTVVYIGKVNEIEFPLK